MTDVSKLVPFTGYYSMNGAPGAFLSIDTTEDLSMAAGIQKTTNITVNVSMDGKSVTPYPFGDGATFDGVTLTVPAAGLTLRFARQYSEGHLLTFSGTIGSKNVDGETYFNPVPLSAFIGDYYFSDAQTSKKVIALSIRSDTEVLFDFSIFPNNPSGKLRMVDRYSYVPAMFVLTFNNTSGSEPSKFMLMLGTASQYGLACSIQDGDTSPKFTPIMALSILPG